MARPERETRVILSGLSALLSERDRGTALEDDADAMRRTLDRYPKRTDRSMLSRIEDSLGDWNHTETAGDLGRTPDQIARYIKKGLPWQSRGIMMPRIEALFIIAVNLDDQLGDNYQAKRRIINQGDDVHVGGLSIADLISIGETKIPLALARRAIVQNAEVDQNQRELGMDDSF